MRLELISKLPVSPLCWVFIFERRRSCLYRFVTLGKIAFFNLNQKTKKNGEKQEQLLILICFLMTYFILEKKVVRGVIFTLF